MNLILQISTFTVSWYILKHILWAFYFFEIHESVLDSVNVTICKVQNSIFSISKKLGWIECIDGDAFTELTYLAFYHKHKVNKNT